MGIRQINRTKYKLYYSCNLEKTGQLGTGSMIRNEITKNILSFEPYNERLCKLQIKGRFNNLSIISAHVSTEEKKKKSSMEIYK